MFDIEFDEAKRRKVIEERGLDLADANLVFAAEHYQIDDVRKDYGERRFQVYGFLHGRRVRLVWTPRDGKRRIITMNHTHEEEHKAYFRAMD